MTDYTTADHIRDAFANARGNADDLLEARDYYTVAELQEDNPRLYDSLEDLGLSLDDDLDDWVTGALDGFAFHVDHGRHFTMWLSMGGPNIYLDITTTDDFSIRSVTFHAHWGSNSDTRRIFPGESLYTIAENYVDLVSELG